MELPPKKMKVLLVQLEKQGCRVNEVKAGYFIKFPDGSSTTFHRTPSDRRAILNMRGHVKRAGLNWPLDGGCKKSA